MEIKTFGEWLGGLDFSYWGTAQHKVAPAKFFERQDGELRLNRWMLGLMLAGVISLILKALF